jgi:hypothetical protein
MLAALALALIAQEPPPPIDADTADAVEEAPPPAPLPRPRAARVTTTTTTTTEAATQAVRRPPQKGDWTEGATFFAGARTAMAFPPEGNGPAPMAGIELGVAADRGVGYGIHVFGATNTPGAPTFHLPPSDYAFGALADLRYYLQTVEPLRLYPTLSIGFMAGPARDTGKNAVLPLVTPGFGARVNLGPVYAALEIGAASFYIPFMAVAIGWEPGKA